MSDRSSWRSRIPILGEEPRLDPKRKRLARSTGEALELIQRYDFDLVISDQRRDNAPEGLPADQEGVRLSKEMTRLQDDWYREKREQDPKFTYERVKVILYVGEVIGRPLHPAFMQ